MTRRGEKTSIAYGTEHQRLRRALEPIVATGTVDCWRCGQKIEPGEPWDLGHDDARAQIMGPEHRHQRPGCPGNRAVGWARLRRRRRRSTPDDDTPVIEPEYGPRPDW